MFSNNRQLSNKVWYSNKEYHAVVKIIIKKFSMCLLGKIFRGKARGKIFCERKGKRISISACIGWILDLNKEHKVRRKEKE